MLQGFDVDVADGLSLVGESRLYAGEVGLVVLESMMMGELSPGR